MAVDVNYLVSMNMWGLTPDFLTTLEEGFKAFFEKEVPGNPLKVEYLIPIFIGAGKDVCKSAGNQRHMVWHDLRRRCRGCKGKL